jgi:ATP-binding cassette, subfamily G (WHITE), member 2, PDR
MLEVIGAAPGSHTDIDWQKTWRESPEYKEVHRNLNQMKDELPHITQPSATPDDKASFREFAAPFGVQQWEVTKRVFEQYWRTPSYIYSKASLCIFSVHLLGPCLLCL